MFGIVEEEGNGYVGEFLEKGGLIERKGIKEEGKKGKLVLVICIIY